MKVLKSGNLHPGYVPSENQRFSDVFRGYQEISGMKWVNEFHLMEQDDGSTDENDIEALMLTQDKTLRKATLTSKIMIAFLGNSP